MRPSTVLNAAEQRKSRLDRAGAFGQQLGEADIAARGVEPVAPQRARKLGVAMHAGEIEEDIDRQQILRTRMADPIGDALAPGRERAAPLRILGHDAALAIGHPDLVQDVGDTRRQSLEPAVGIAARLAFGKDDRIVLVHRQQAFAAAGGAEHRKRVVRQGDRRSLRPSAPLPPVPPRGASARRSRATSRPRRRDPARLPPPARPPRAGAWPRRRASSGTEPAASISSPSRTASSARRRKRSRADKAPQMRPFSSSTPRCRTLSRLMRPMAR